MALSAVAASKAHCTVAPKSPLSIRAACAVFSISETCYRYQAKHASENDAIADWLVRLTHNLHSWGFGLCFLYLRNVQQFATEWLWTCDHERPNMALGSMTQKRKLALVA